MLILERISAKMMETINPTMALLPFILQDTVNALYIRAIIQIENSNSIKLQIKKTVLIWFKLTGCNAGTKPIIAAKSIGARAKANVPATSISLMFDLERTKPATKKITTELRQAFSCSKT